MALAIGKQAPAGFGYAAAVADRGQRVLQRTPAAHVHVHITTGNQWQAVAFAEGLQLLQAMRVVMLVMQLHRQPQAIIEAGAQQLQIGGGRLPVQPQAEQAVGQAEQVVAEATVFALGRASPAGGDQLAQPGIGGLVGAQQGQLRSVLDLELSADDQRHAMRLRRLPGAHDAGQRALVGDRQRPVALAGGAREQFFGNRGAALETERRQAVQFGVAGQFTVHGGSAEPAVQHPRCMRIVACAEGPAALAMRGFHHVVVAPCVGLVPPARFDALRPGDDAQAWITQRLRRIQQPARA
ncbi:hypothetical protein G6F57_015828 [Rhizopus arrhizus]|nr:hypothetical protein G6F57_015828 [Rhizopus arrhizus]